MSLEMRPPGYVELAPGDRASSSVTWGGWDGPPSSGRFIAHWPGGQTEIHAQGPPQPTNHGPATNLSTSWFDLLP